MRPPSNGIKAPEEDVQQHFGVKLLIIYGVANCCEFVY